MTVSARPAHKSRGAVDIRLVVQIIARMFYSGKKIAPSLLFIILTAGICCLVSEADRVFLRALLWRIMSITKFVTAIRIFCWRRISVVMRHRTSFTHSRYVPHVFVSRATLGLARGRARPFSFFWTPFCTPEIVRYRLLFLSKAKRPPVGIQSGGLCR